MSAGIIKQVHGPSKTLSQIIYRTQALLRGTNSLQA